MWESSAGDLAAALPAVQRMRFDTRHGAADGRPWPSRVRRRVFAAMVAIVIAFCAVTARLPCGLRKVCPARVSAIVMLAARAIACP